MLKWKKMGNVFNTAQGKPREWMQEYAQCPFPLVLDEKRIRVYITTRGLRGADGQHISFPSYVDLDRNDLTRVIGLPRQPLMPLGSAGSFDEFGITPCSFIKRPEGIYAYYTGWTRMQSVPYTMSIGIALSRDGGDTYEKLWNGPLLSPNKTEAFLLSSPIVKIIDDTWHMWYLSGTKWIKSDNKYEAVYQIVHATSYDGLEWKRDGIPVIPSHSEDECQVSFALFKKQSEWNAIFAYRQPVGFRKNPERSYKLGYVRSNDLKTWKRDDNMSGLRLSDSGWDSEMMCYPQVLELDSKVYLFYCGNDFGREGFGIAELLN